MNNLIKKYYKLNPKSDYYTISQIFGLSPLDIHKMLNPNIKPYLDYLVKSHVYDNYYTITIYGYGIKNDDDILNIWYRFRIPFFSRGSAIRFAEQKISTFLEDYLVV